VQPLCCSSPLVLRQRLLPERNSGASAIQIPSTAGWIAIKSTDWQGCSSIRDGGASPLFPPLYHSEEEAKEALAHLVRRDPRQFGVERTRWDLPNLLAQLTDFHLKGPSSLWHLLDRLGIRWLRGRAHIHSPDPLYQAKRDFIEQLKQQVRTSEGKQVLLYLDECSSKRQPTLACAYAPSGEPGRAEQSYRSNTTTRLAATLNAQTGAVQALSGSKVGPKQLVALYQQVRQAYPAVERIWIVQDNWPEQPSSAAIKRYGTWHLPIQLVVLPSYASWLNPIEKLWRKLRQDVLHLHQQADDLIGLRERVLVFLRQFQDGSPELLRYVGLLPN
jgi:hypothetical protein